MKKIFIIVILSLSVFLAKGQRPGQIIFVNVTHELTQLVFTNEEIQNELERLLLCAKQKIPREFERYKYFNLRVRGNELIFALSNYPYKSFFYTAGIGFNIGFFVLQERIVLVHNELPDFLKPTQYKKTFSYREERMISIEAGSWFVLNEDDTSTWVIEYKNNQLNVICCPINTLLRFQ